MSALLYIPVISVLIVIERPQLSWLHILFILGTACLRCAYLLSLQRGYAVGDFSLTYPLARGAASLFIALSAILFFGERPSAVALSGVVLLSGGVVILTGNPVRIIEGGKGIYGVVGYALLTSLFIAAYTLWDKYAVSVLFISPLLLDGSANVARAGLLTCTVIGKWSDVRETWRKHYWEVVGVALLSPLAYVLVLYAMISSPVSYVAPLRESSILIGAFLGVHVLAEGQAFRRLGATGVIFIGIVLLAMGQGV